MDVRRKRLMFRTHHMGTQENDLIFGGFAEQNLDCLDDALLDQLEALLEENDIDLYNWVSGREPVPERHDNALMKLLIDFRSGPVTR